VVLYVSSEKFINQFMDHSRNNAINDFIHFYQLIDVLILDDVQFFAKAERSQDAFFAIFNHLHQSQKQLVLTSDKSPKDLEGVQDRLLSRFRWGLSADLQVPDYETRIEILEKKMRNDGLEMPKEVVKYIAYNINNNVRELEGALISLLAQSSLNRKEIDLDLAKKVLRNFVKSSSKEITLIPYKRWCANILMCLTISYFKKHASGKLYKLDRSPCIWPKRSQRILSKQSVNILEVGIIPPLSTLAKQSRI